ncbi:hypothetical protein P154DRAFT_566924 [Amniculicola lignicola CBS 123094]|uniref:Nicotinamide-nucleotide adenylyltransferase n=1 Tax=Amniculicola lignicola CBS 123094 TaxID=1392246 RepID=A0A6A5W298_9PLEO|nr:hypothetical protein P154DRAFT_566924 [Amniculicola lignicola CBS 123094]
MSTLSTRLSAIKSLLPALESTLKSFTTSSSKFQIVRTVNPSSTPPRTLYILDSSFNPPSLAHLVLALKAVTHPKENDAYPHRILLLFSTSNADKAPSPASFAQRLAMMTIFAEDLVLKLKGFAESASGDTGGKVDVEERLDSIPIDIGLTKEPYYTDKSLAIDNTDPPAYPSQPKHVHLVGYDTLIRFCNPKYYPSYTPPLSALTRFFDAGHKLRVTLRPYDERDKSSREFGTMEEQEEYVGRLGTGERGEEGWRREWAERIDVDRPDSGVGISSTRVRTTTRHLTHLSPGCTVRLRTTGTSDGDVDRLRRLTCKMASKLCCTTEQEGRANSPDLPNVRLSDATPARRPLLPKDASSPSSQFTSARSEELHELRQIFDNARDDEMNPVSTPKSHRSRFSRPSVHSLPKIRSVHALIRRKLSKDLGKSTPTTPLNHGGKQKQVVHDQADTVVKSPRKGPNLQLKITKDDLRKDLLSDKKPDQGGYDSDAEVLDDIAKNVGKRTPSKRPSIHRSTKNGRTPEAGRETGVYDIEASRSAVRTPLFSRFSQITSTPNLLFETNKAKERKVRRSHSATSIELPVPSPIPPMRLPSISADEGDDVPWATDMVQSLRLSQFSTGPSSKPSKPSLPQTDSIKREIRKKDISNVEASISPIVKKALDVVPLQIHIQEPTASPRPSASIKENAPPPGVEDSKKVDDKADQSVGHENENDRDARRSVHLYSMRISHHLRSGSLLSWDNLTDAPELPTPPRMLRDRATSNMSKLSRVQQLEGRSRHERQSSSSGFASSKVPSKWGKVREPKEGKSEMSSVYSSRPQSPPDSFGGSFGNLSLPIAQHGASKNPSRRHSDSILTDAEETPKPVKQLGTKSSRNPSGATQVTNITQEAPRLARNNSVADTKKSKFREEFSPSPPRKKPTTSESIMKFLRPRNSVRSRSETSLKAIPKVDGAFDRPDASYKRERRVSRSLMSLQAEQSALGKDKTVDPMWDRALKTYQDERATMFLTPNKAQATQGSPFRERSGSLLRVKSISSHGNSLEPSPNASMKRVSAPPSMFPSTPNDSHPVPLPLVSRRSALIGTDLDDISPTAEVQNAFHRQTDSKEVVGAWGRYPSHSREDRTASASHLDRVRTRDFALEPALQFAMGNDVESEVDPGERPSTPDTPPGIKKRKKRVSSGRMAKSSSMTFGKQFLKNYTRIFRSQSTEFQKHGQGHRSSVAAGGMLEYPELEILPEVWRRGLVDEKERSGESHRELHGHTPGPAHDGTAPSTYTTEDSMATLRPPRTRQSFDGVAESDSPTDRARIWSVYYEGLLPGFPRGSMDLASLADFGGIAGNEMVRARHSFDSKTDRAKIHSSTPSMLSRTLPPRFDKHARGLSRVSMKSGASGVPSFLLVGGNGNGNGEGEEEGEGEGEEKSIVSVRTSTMDLIGLYREQEMRERERVLGLLRRESLAGRV